MSSTFPLPLRVSPGVSPGSLTPALHGCNRSQQRRLSHHRHIEATDQCGPRVQLPKGGPDSAKLYTEMVRRGVHVLPCPPFHWANPDEGMLLIRLSRARPTGAVQTAARTLDVERTPAQTVGLPSMNPPAPPVV